MTNKPVLRCCAGCEFHLGMLFAQAEGLVRSSWPAKLTGALAALANFAVNDLFSGLLLIFMASSTWDYFLGRRAAAHEGKFDSRASYNGLVAKMSGVVILLLIRLVEYWALRHDLLDILRLGGEIPSGIISTGFVAIALYDQWKSIAKNHERLGKPLPFAGAVESVIGRIRVRKPETKP